MSTFYIAETCSFCNVDLAENIDHHPSCCYYENLEDDRVLDAEFLELITLKSKV